jgi:hemerythrin-like domain-containing protein
MEQQLERNIKELMEQHPALGAALEAAGIGCTSCALGTCRVRDILEIHDLDEVATGKLLNRLGEIIYGGAPFTVSRLERKPTVIRAAFCPPIARMVEEHACIKRLISLLPKLAEALTEDLEQARPLAEGALDFIRNYADRYHHAKEEDVLFGFFDPQSEILKAMHQDHSEGREHVRAAALALREGDAAEFGVRLRAYGELLTGHIHREDTILYPWMDRSLSDRQVGQLFAQCMAVEARLAGAAKKHEAFVASLEARFSV